MNKTVEQVIKFVEKKFPMGRKKGQKAVDFEREQIIQTSIFKGFFRVCDIDVDLNRVYFYSMNECSDLAHLDAEFIREVEVDQDLVEILYGPTKENDDEYCNRPEKFTRYDSAE